MPKITLTIYATEPISPELAHQLLNEVGFEVVRTKQDYSFAMSQKPKEERTAIGSNP